MSFPFLQPPPPPPLPPPQTITIYPNPVVTTHPPFTQSSSSHHSSGSFRMALLVLAIVVVVSTVACCLGRLRNRARDRRHDDRPAMQKSRRQDFDHRQGGNDVEFGFERRERALNNPGKGVNAGRGYGLRGEMSGVPKPNDMDGAHLHGDAVESKGPPA